LFKIPYPGWVSVGTFALTEAFENASEMPVFDVTVTGGGKVARVKFFSDTAAELAIFRVTRRIFPNFPGLDGSTIIYGHLKAKRVSKFRFNFFNFYQLILF
jgi:hypothetical protein